MNQELINKAIAAYIKQELESQGRSFVGRDLEFSAAPVSNQHRITPLTEPTWSVDAQYSDAIFNPMNLLEKQAGFATVYVRVLEREDGYFSFMAADSIEDLGSHTTRIKNCEKFEPLSIADLHGALIDRL